MFNRILVPVDFSSKNKKSLEIAVNIATHYQGSIDVLHVVEIIADTNFADFDAFYGKLEKRAVKFMDKLLTPYEENSLTISRQVVYGNRVREILEYAGKKHVDLIIMNSHKIDPKNPVQGWGTISHKVGIMSRCPVMLVK